MPTITDHGHDPRDLHGFHHVITIMLYARANGETARLSRLPALHAARDDMTRLTNLYTGRPARGLITRFMHEQGPMSTVAPAFPLATGAVDPLRATFEKSGRSDFSILWAGEAAALAREEDAGHLTSRLWEDALKCSAGLRL